MPLIKSLAHVCLKTADLEKTTAFYCGALGMEKLFDFTRRGEVIGFYLKASDRTFIEVFRVDQPATGSSRQNLHHFCLETDQIEEVREVLRARGYAPGEVKQGADRSLQFWVKAPDAVDVEFHQYTAGSSQLNGQSVEVDW